jgi:hypothetical protein
MGMREKIAWKHIINQKGNLYLMDTADKTYVVDFGKLKPRAKTHLERMHLFHMIGIYAFPIAMMILTAGMTPDISGKLLIVFLSMAFVYLADYLMMIFLIIPKNIVDILEVKKQ